MAAINCPRCNGYSSPSQALLVEHLHTHIRPFRCANCPHDEARAYASHDPSPIDRLRTHTRSAHGRNNLLPGEAPPANFRALVRVEAAGGPFVNLPPRPVAPAANPPLAGPLVALLPAPVVVAAPAPPPAMAPPPVIMAAPPVIMAAPPAQQQQQQQQQPLPPPPFANPLPPPRTYPSTPFMTNRVTDESTSLALRQLA
ncbi:hypothetical protein D6D11_05912 [Aureobasidium pullulans]|nr:hypothetical protein D6D11_05912 [Aureobasidium pullulans]